MSEAAQLPSLDARIQLYQIGQGFATLQFVQAAIDLKVADALDAVDGAAVAVTQLAERVGADPDALGRLMRALACQGIFTEVEPGRFAHTELSRMFRSDAPWHAHDVIRFGWMHVPMTVLHHVAEAVRTGEAQFPKLFGVDAQTYFVRDDPEAGGIFNRAMTANTILLNNAPALIEALPLADGTTIVDIGGGHGQLVVGLLERYPGARAVLLELEQVVVGANEKLQPGGALAARVELVTGDCRQSVPAGADIYLFKHMMYMWDDDMVVQVLRTARNAAAGGARVVVVDMLLGGDSAFERVGAAVDLLMILMGGGKRRSVQDFAVLFEKAGLAFQGCSGIEGDQSVLLNARVP